MGAIGFPVLALTWNERGETAERPGLIFRWIEAIAGRFFSEVPNLIDFEIPKAERPLK